MDAPTLDHIEREVEAAAPRARVWRALTDHKEFGTWFRVKIDQPFAEGRPSTGQFTYPGYEYLKWQATVVAIEPERYFAFTWHPYAVDPETDYSAETPTLVEFTLEPTAKGTRVRVRESGFSKLPPERRDLAFRMNDGGWAEQLRNIAAHVA